MFFSNRSLNGTTQTLKRSDVKLVEAVVVLNSDLIGKSLAELEFREKFGAIVLALRHRGKLMRDKIADTKLSAGDTLLLEIKADRYNQLRSKSVACHYFRNRTKSFIAKPN